jgi:hypothetical protein
MGKCLCGEVRVGGRPTGSRNWNPDCPQHPMTQKMKDRAFKATLMQALAGAVRLAHQRDTDTTRK